MEVDEFSRTELDSHANMVVVGKNCRVLRSTGRTVDVNPFTPDYDAMRQVPVVDAALFYECPTTGSEYLLVVLGAIFVKAMQHNLVPPFIMREAGITVNETAKIHVDQPTVNDHAIIMPKGTLRIPLSLHGTFSYFDTRAPSEKQVEEIQDVHLLTPEWRWNPHSEVYASNEDAMVDWEGNIRPVDGRIKLVLDDLPDDDGSIHVSATISVMEADKIDQNFSDTTPMTNGRINDENNFDDVIYWPNGEVSQIHDPETLSTLLEQKRADSVFKMAIGATTATPTDEPWPEEDQLDMTILEFLTVGAAHARPRKTVDAEHLSKVWRIDLKTAERTLAATSQHMARSQGSNTTRNFTTNDRSLRMCRKL